MQFRDWLLSEIHWYSFPSMDINGVTADGIDFHFERYPNDILIDRKSLVQGSSVSAPLNDGTWLNVIPHKSEDNVIQNMNLGQYQATIKRQAVRPDLGGPAASLSNPENEIKIEPQPLPRSVKLPSIWFKLAKLTLGNQEVKAAGEEAFSAEKQIVPAEIEPIQLQPIPR